MQVTVDIPDELAEQLIPLGHDRSRSLIEGATLKAFCENRVSAHELRLVLGLATRYELEEFLKERGIDHGGYGPEDLEQDVATLTRAGARAEL